MCCRKGQKWCCWHPWLSKEKGGTSRFLARIRKEGFVRIRVDGDILHADEVHALDKNKKHSIEVVVDRLVIKESIRRRLSIR